MNIIKNLKAKSYKNYTLEEMIIYVVIIFLIACCVTGMTVSLLLSMFSSSILLLFLVIFLGFLGIFPTAIYLYISNKDL